MKNPWEFPTDEMIKTAREISMDLNIPLDNVIAVLRAHMDIYINKSKEVKN